MSDLPPPTTTPISTQDMLDFYINFIYLLWFLLSIYLSIYLFICLLARLTRDRPEHESPHRTRTVTTSFFVDGDEFPPALFPRNPCVRTVGTTNGLVRDGDVRGR